MRILSDVKLDFDDVLICPQRSSLTSRADVTLSREFKFPHARFTIETIGIIASNMYHTGTKAMAKALAKFNCMTALHKYHDWNEELLSEVCEENFFITIGEGDSIPSKSTMVCVDVANGYRQSFVDYIKKIRDIHQDQIVIMAGNVCTADMTAELILAGADIVKVGIGPGSACQTRQITGIGYPQLSAIIECADVSHGLKGLICADGGMKTSGDIAKAFCAGADFVMLGGILAGMDECDGEWKYINNKYYSYIDPNSSLAGSYPFVEGGISGYAVNGTGNYINTFDKSKDKLVEYGEKCSLKFYGMSSHEAMEKFGGADKDYRASEGKCIEVSYKGPVKNVIKEILGGLRSTGTYLGAERIKDFPKRATLCRVNK